MTVMKRVRFPYREKRSNKYVAYADNVICGGLLVCFVFQSFLGIPQWIQSQFGVSEFWAKLTVVVGVIALTAIEQFITYHIDRWIEKTNDALCRAWRQGLLRPSVSHASETGGQRNVFAQKDSKTFFAGGLIVGG